MYIGGRMSILDKHISRVSNNIALKMVTGSRLVFKRNVSLSADAI